MERRAVRSPISAKEVLEVLQSTVRRQAGLASSAVAWEMRPLTAATARCHPVDPFAVKPPLVFPFRFGEITR
jgi:hypothetical protein